MRAILCAAALSWLLGGCSWFPSLAVYKLDINQGNFITQDQVDKLKVGQTRAQVKSALGTPMLSDPFHVDRWDYAYLFTRQGITIEHRQFTVYFVDQKLARWEGDEAPPPPIEVARSGGGDSALDKSLATAPNTARETWLERLLKKLGWMQ
jgi:outer membrane protein assembly factor BamE